MKLLIVEDEAKTANFLKRGLTEAGFQVIVATDGHEGKRQIEIGSFDLIVLDILLPEWTAGRFWPGRAQRACKLPYCC